MALTRLAGKCRRCPFVETCDHKQMETFAAVQLPIVTANVIVPNMLDINGTKRIIDKIEQDIIKSLCLSRRHGGPL